MRRECWERFSRHRLQRKPLVNDPSMRDVSAVMHVEIANPRWQRKRSLHSRRMRKPAIIHIWQVVNWNEYNQEDISLTEDEYDLGWSNPLYNVGCDDPFT